ncbi:amino acid permease [Sulfolobales archaeon HS-7]|nr:amino acid permease [Sulfolobales archaeon HS-7]
MLRLTRGSVGIKEAYSQAMAVTAPLGSVVSTTTAAVAYAGGGVLLATFLALLASAMWIFTLTRYSGKVASAGGFYSFSSAAWGSKKVSFFEAFIEIGAYVILNAANVIATITILKFVNSLGFTIPSFISWLVLGICVIYPTLLSLYDVRKVLGRVVLIAGSAEVALLIMMFIYSVVTRGFQPHLFVSTRSIGTGGFALAFILTLVSISGAGAATYLGEEAKLPTKTINLGMWLSLIIGGIAISLGTYGLLSLWSGPIASIQNSQQPLLAEFSRIGTFPLLLTMVLAINSLVTSNIGTTLGSARILFNLSRENAAPKLFSKMSKSGQPIVATIVIGIFTALLSILPSLVEGFYSAFLDVSAIASIFWVTGRLIDSAGVPVFLMRIRRLSVMSLIIPLVVTALNVWGISVSVSQFDIVQAGIITITAGLLILWYARYGRKGKPGSLMVDDKGELITRDELLKRLIAGT